MVKRQYNLDDNEPEQMKFEMPSEREHLFQVVDIYTIEDEMGVKLGLNEDTVAVKCEVCTEGEEGRTTLQRLTLDEQAKGFFAVRLFLKAIGEEYKGSGLTIDTDRWVGRQFYATIVHNQSKGKTYANIAEYNFEKKIDQHYKTPVGNPDNVKSPEDIAIDWSE